MFCLRKVTLFISFTHSVYHTGLENPRSNKLHRYYAYDSFIIERGFCLFVLCIETKGLFMKKKRRRRKKEERERLLTFFRKIRPQNSVLHSFENGLMSKLHIVLKHHYLHSRLVTIVFTQIQIGCNFFNCFNIN